MSNFWKDFTFSPIDDIFKDPNFTLQDLLDEDDVVVEVRNHKEELVNYMIQPQIIDQLITYIVDEPDQNANEKVKFRYPVVACEILCSEVDTVLNALLNNTEVLDKIYGFFSRPNVNLLLANLVVRIIATLLASKPKESLAYLKERPQIIENFLNHLECAATSEFFARLISADSEPDGSGTLAWLVEAGFVEKIISKFSTSYEGLHCDVAQAIIDVMITSAFESPLMERLLSENTCNTLYQMMIDPQNPSAFRYGMKVLIQMLKCIAVASEETFDSDDDEDKPKRSKPSQPPNAPLQSLPPPICVFVSHIDAFCKLLVSPTKVSSISLQNGVTVEAFGFIRLGVLQMVETLLLFNYIAVHEAILNSEFFPIVVDHFFNYNHSNFCHRMVQGIVSRFLEQSVVHSSTFGNEAQIKFFKKTQLAQKLIKAEEENKVDVANHRDKVEGGAPRRPYMPFVHIMGSEIQALTTNNAPLKDILEALPGWVEFIEVVKEEHARIQALKAVDPKEQEEHYQFTAKPSDLHEQKNDAYLEGRDGDEEDLSLSDDVDMDSSNDADDYDIEQAEILLTKQEIEAFA
eukprot:TRINITY_DN191_c2_g1_i1.p1 TRINITY_DN191_c2_g1~~TRINITY_DN191_c2_g1_i1.p1  ORF type:complete len:575 (+),score=158.40 TRINITY_DN191_c2_g1_i1:43-1767(+)